MGSVTIRNIDDDVKRGVRLAAAANGRSLEAELRALLKRTYAPVIDEHATRLRAMPAKEAVAHLIKVANGAGEGVFDELEDDAYQSFDKADRARRIRELSGDDWVSELIAITRPGMDIDLPPRANLASHEAFGAD